MPRSKNPKKSVEKDDQNANRPYYLPFDAKWGGYIDLRLGDDQKAVFQDWFLAPNCNWWDLLCDALAKGLALSLKWDSENDCYTASLTGAGISNSNERYALTSRSSQANEALALCVYKHDVLMGGTWDSYLPRSGKLRSWG